MKIRVFLRINSRESIRPTRLNSRCESPGQTPFSRFLIFSLARNAVSEGRGCLQEGCLGLPGVLPDIFRTAIFTRKWRKRRQEPELPDLAWNSQTSFSQTSATFLQWNWAHRVSRARVEQCLVRRPGAYESLLELNSGFVSATHGAQLETPKILRRDSGHVRPR